MKRVLHIHININCLDMSSKRAAIVFVVVEILQCNKQEIEKRVLINLIYIKNIIFHIANSDLNNIG